MNARQISVTSITSVLLRGMHLDKALAKHSAETTDKRELKLAQEISYGVMRWYHQLMYITGLLLDKPLKEKDTDIQAVILTGLYQLRHLRIPDHAAISTSVETVDAIGKGWAKNLVNAVLRRYQRESADIDKRIAANPVASCSHPDWMLGLYQAQWPDHWRAIVASNNRPPPLQLRVNSGKISRQEYLKCLDAKGLAYSVSPLVATGLTLDKPMPVGEIPGFFEGLVSVQDYGAQLAAGLLDCHTGQRVLDACAAPGGKTGHILEIPHGPGSLVALDVNPARLELVQQTLLRLGLAATLVEANLCDTPEWWDSIPFDRILLDAPCSATGVIRRHPDIKVTRNPSQISRLVDTQQLMLRNTWPMLAPGGRLLYCTCSNITDETDGQISRFLDQANDAEPLVFQAAWGVKSQFGRHTIPGQQDTDGFYYSLLVKKSQEHA